MRIEHSDDDTLGFLDEAGMAFMALTAHRLNSALLENGIADPVTRQSICESFMFSFAYHHDAGWLISDGREVFPMVTLAERMVPADGENLGPIETLHVPTDASSWHEYAHGVIAQYFEEDGEAVPDIRRGSYDLED